MNATPPIRCVGRYLYAVPSVSKPGDWHTVDLTGNGGAGCCTCRDHATRRQPAIDRGNPILTQQTTCRHVRAAAWHFLRDVLPNLAATESTPKR